MKSVTELMHSYASYHRDPRNKVTHFIGVPLIVYALFLLLCEIQVAGTESWPLPVTGGLIGFTLCFFYYLRLDPILALLQLPFSALPLYLADQTAAALPIGDVMRIFGATFLGGWIIQFIGHYFEGKKPALFDNIMQVFSAPLFLAMETAFALGLHKSLRQSVEGK